MTAPDRQNAPAETFQDEHRAVAEAMNETRRLLARHDRTRRQVDRQIWRVAELIEAHFAHEEEGGYMAEATERAQRLLPLAEKLLAEHTELLDEAKRLQILAHAGVESEAWWRQIELDFQRLHKRLREHEHAENKLLQEAYARDIGGNDG